MTEFEILTRDIEHIKKTVDNLNEKINDVSIEVAKTSTRMEMLKNSIDDQVASLSKHEKECPARRDLDEIRQQVIRFSVKLLISYLALSVAAASVYAAIQKLF